MNDLKMARQKRIHPNHFLQIIFSRMINVGSFLSFKCIPSWRVQQLNPFTILISRRFFHFVCSQASHYVTSRTIYKVTMSRSSEWHYNHQHQSNTCRSVFPQMRRRGVTVNAKLEMTCISLKSESHNHIISSQNVTIGGKLCLKLENQILQYRPKCTK